MFKKDAIMAMSQEQLNARLKEINSQARTATGEELNDLLAEAEFISEVKAEASNRAKLMAMTQRFLRRQREVRSLRMVTRLHLIPRWQEYVMRLQVLMQ